MRLPLAASIAAACLLAACANEQDRAARERIFSPEDPPRVLLAAAEPLDAGALAKDPALVDRVLSISAQEAAARIGPHRQDVQVRFRWTAGGRNVALSEERMVVLGKGGDFHARIDNDERQGMEWVKVDGVSYARSRYAKFRERRRDRGASEHVVDEAYATLATFRDWMHGAVSLTRAGEKTVGGRRAIEYSLALGTPRDSARAAHLPPVIFPEGGPDPDTALRLAALEQGRVQSVTGTLAVDAETAVPLEAKLKAAVVVPGDREARLELSIDLETKAHSGTIEVPEHIEDAPRPPGVVATLEAYGFQRGNDAPADEEGEAAGENPPPED